MRLQILLTIFILCFISTGNTQESSAVKKPKNIILLIGDGMGLSEISAAQFFNEGDSHFDRFPTIGLIKTSAADNLITDSAAGATAFSCGIKTYNGAIAMNVQKKPVKTILEQLSEQGYDTGIISTSSITHATPASFFAHVEKRRQAEDIAQFLPESDVDFIAGGGLQYFNKRSDQLDLLPKLQQHGFAVDTTKLGAISGAMKQVYLLADDGMPRMSEGRGSFLSEATALAVERLSQNEEGFFLMVEGSQIDWGGHANEAGYLISELIDFDNAIGTALDFAEKDGETLVIVTADHETGGFTLSSDGRNYNKILPSFSTDGHSATMVPVFAKGPGASTFGGIYENTQIYHKMSALVLNQ
ncbi:alkaline phosphatase [Altibacter sp. HG106]|uniref:alkaline phosphatase n=1 Tax=Altibacter sp. HG106 TaxID=3023937 RepID=UPI002350166F|nr:alkaline phosphatase [Altibacter sp. HG106]MDC7995956.1 alkaline phosphatase [Altibacter sp. HG106]